jgi:hypothetical protein
MLYPTELRGQIDHSAYRHKGRSLALSIPSILLIKFLWKNLSRYFSYL